MLGYPVKRPIGLPLRLEFVTAERDRLQTINDELVAALKLLYSELNERYLTKLDGSQNSYGEIPSEKDRDILAKMRQLLHQARAALAKATA